MSITVFIETNKHIDWQQSQCILICFSHNFFRPLCIDCAPCWHHSFLFMSITAMTSRSIIETCIMDARQLRAIIIPSLVEPLIQTLDCNWHHKYHMEICMIDIHWHTYTHETWRQKHHHHHHYNHGSNKIYSSICRTAINHWRWQTLGMFRDTKPRPNMCRV